MKNWNWRKIGKTALRRIFSALLMAALLFLGATLAEGVIKKIDMTMTAEDVTTNPNVWSKEVTDSGDPLPVDGKTYYVYEDPVPGYTTDCSYDNPCRLDPSGTTTITNTSGFITVTFNANGGSGEMADQRFDAGVSQALHENQFTAPVGYHFGGWATISAATKPTYSNGQSVRLASSLTLYAFWVGNDNTAYKVNHYLMTADGLDYELYETVNLTGTTGATVSPPTKSYPGFTSPDKQSVTIAADGSSYVDYRYTRNQYIATFSSQSGDIVPARTYYYGQEFSDLPEVTRVGYDFLGWNTSKDGTGTTINALSTMPAKSTTYYGIWTGSTNTKYVVNHRFMNTDGRTYTDERLELTGTTGDTVTPEVYFRDGFTSPSPKSATIKADGTTVIEYKYTRNQYTLTYNANGGEGTRSMRYYYDDLLGELPVPTYKGYVFKEWNTKLLGDGDTITMETKMPDGDMTVYAQWIPADDTEYTVRYLLMNTTGSDYKLDDYVVMTGTTGERVTPEVPVYEGFTAPNPQSAVIAADGSTTIDYKYSRNKYIVTFDPNGGTGTNAGEVYFGANIGTLPTPTRVGYKLSSWNTSAAGSGNTVTASTKMPANDLTVYAQWTATGVSYSVRHMTMNVDGETYSIKDLESLTALADSTVTPAVRSYTGFTSPEIRSEQVSPDGSTVIDYKYTRNKYNVTFDTQGGSEAAGISRYYEEEYGMFPETIRAGYTLNGWSLRATGGALVNDYDLMPARNHTLYAQWSANTGIPYVVNHYKMNLDGETYTLAEQEELSGTADNQVTPSVKSYTGFTSPSAQKVTIAPDGSTVVNYYYARNQYTITFNGNGGSGTESRKLYYGSVLGALPEAARTGYTLKGWNSRTSGDGFEATPETLVETSVTYYALWNTNSYSITYVLNGGVNASQNPTSYNVTTNDITLRAPTRVGYTFTGWTYDEVLEPQLNVKIVKGSTGDKTFTANWTVNTYTATFDPNGGTGGTSITKPYGEQFGSLPIPSRTGYTFIGWFTAQEGGTQVGEQTTMPGADTTYYAQWLANDGIRYEVDYLLMNTDGRTYSTADTFIYSGTAGETVTPTVRNYEGFISPAAQTKTIAADGTTVFEFRYQRKQWSLKFDANTGEGSKSVTKYFDAEIGEAPTTIKKTGYTLASWNTAMDGSGDTISSFDKMPNSDLTIYAQWSASENTKYTVKHQQMNTDGIGWTVVKTISLTGTTGSTVTPEVTEYAGFTSPEPQSATVAGDGSTIITYSYMRNQYPVVFKGNQGTPESTSQMYYYGASITNTPAVTREGYSLGSWNTDPNGNGVKLSNNVKVEAREMTFYAQWTANANTPYTVEYALMNVNGRGYTVAETVTYTGKTDSTVTAPVKKYTGFISPAAEAVTIAADGSSSVRYEYARTQYNITYNGNGGTSPAVSKHYYDAEIGTLPESERAGYDFAGWNTKADGTGETYYASTTMPAANVTLYAQWSAHLNTPYTVNHSLMGLDGRTYSVADVDELTGTTGSRVTPAVKSYTGFTSPAAQTVTVAGDGSTVVEYKYSRNKYPLTFNANGGTGTKSNTYYYQETVETFPTVTRAGYNLIGWNTSADGSGMDVAVGMQMAAAETVIYAQWEVGMDTKYTVRHYQMNVDGRNYTLYETENLSGMTGAVVTPAVKEYAGFTSPETQTISIAADGSAVVDYRYVRNTYLATFNANGGEGDADREVMYNAALGTLPTPSRAGYKFLSWNTKVDGTGITATSTTKMPANDITYYAQWKAASGVKYTVNHYQMDVNGSGYKLADTDVLSGTTGETVTPSVNNYNGFTAPETQTITIAPDGSSVVEYRYTRNRYTVSFNGNGGANAGAITGYYGAELGTLPESTRAGYAFTGWNTSAGGTGSAVTESSTIPAANVSYYAQWKANEDTEYTVRHMVMDLDGVTYVTQETEILTGTTGAKVTPPVKSYTGFTAPRTQTVTIDGTGSTAVDYKYTRNQYTVTFNASGGSDVDSKKGYYGAVLGTLPVTERNGYQLKGWFTRSSGGTQISDATTIPASNTTYYAQWTANTYTIEFNANGGSGDMEPQTAAYDETVVLNGNAYTMQGYVFKNWNTKADGTGKTYANKASVKNLTDENEGSAVLYAQWEAATDTEYTVNHYKEGLNGSYEIAATEILTGKTGARVTPAVKTYSGFTAPSAETINIAADGSSSVDYFYTRNSYLIQFNLNGKGTMEPLSRKYEEEYGTLPDARAEGYTFNGWFTRNSGGDPISEQTTMPANNVTIYAQWTAEESSYTVNHYLEDLNGVYQLDDSYTLTADTGTKVTPAVKSYDGFTAPKTQSVVVAGDGSTVVDYKYTRRSYTVTFNGNGGQGAASVTKRFEETLGTVPESARNGYTFNGWNSSRDGTGYDAEPTTVIMANTTFYAQWSAISYAISYDLAGGRNHADNPTAYTIASSSITLKAPTREGYNFTGWIPAGETEPVLSPVIPNGSTGDRSYTATWELKSYRATFDANGGTGGGSKVYEYGEPFGDLPSASRSGYQHVGWFTEKTAGYQITASDTMPGADTTYYAHWIAAEDTPVTVNHYQMEADGRTYALFETEILSGTTGTVITPDVKSYSGFVSPNPQSATVKADGTTVINYRYSRTQYTVTYKANGGKSDTTISKYHGAELGTLPTATRTGYVFESWNTKADGSGEMVTEYTIMPMNNVTYYAQWTPGTAKYTVKHMKADTEGESYSTAATETFNGETGSSVTPAVKNYTGFVSPELQTETVEGDGSTVIEYRYDRKSFEVTYDANGGTGGSEDTVVYGAKIYKESTPTPTRKGYLFNGWNTKTDGTGSKLTTSVTMGSSDVSYYAQWKPITYTVNYFGNGAESGRTNSTTLTYDKTGSLAANGFKKNGFVFTNWNTAADGSGDSYEANEAVMNLADENNAELDMYAQWNVADYKITYNLAGGENSPSNPDTYTIKDTFTLSAPTRTGFTFTGWTGTDLKSASIDVTVPEGSSGDRSYTANWKRNTLTATFSVFWDDDSNHDGKRPSSVRAVLSGSDGSSKAVSLTENNGYNAAITGLYTHTEEGELIDYSASASGGTDYTYSITQLRGIEKNYSITASHANVKVTPSVSLRWSDQSSDTRPGSVTVYLSKNGSAAGSAVLSASNNWAASFPEVELYENGRQGTFTVSADAVTNYRTSVSGSVNNGFVVTESYSGTSPTPSPTASPTYAPSPTYSPYSPTAAPTAAPGGDSTKVYTVIFTDCLNSRIIASYEVKAGESVKNPPAGYYAEDYTNVTSNRTIRPTACTVRPGTGADTGDKGLIGYAICFVIALLGVGGALFTLRRYE